MDRRFSIGLDSGTSSVQVVAVELASGDEMPLRTDRIDPNALLLERYVLDKHDQRNHGPATNYGQKQQDRPLDGVSKL